MRGSGEEDVASIGEIVLSGYFGHHPPFATISFASAVSVLLRGRKAAVVAHPTTDDEGHALFSSTSEDRDLTLAFQHGEKGAYQAIHDRYAGRVHAVCRRMLLKPEDAQEAAQEAFLRVYQGLARFNGQFQLGPWIARIATNVCLDHLRAAARRPSDASLELVEIEADHGHDSDPESVTIRRSEGRRVRRVLGDLPPMHRAAIVLRDFEGLSYQEIAAILDISEAQVKALIHRARQKFKRNWSSLAGFLPWRVAQRLRDGEHLVRDSAVLGPAAQVAPACSTVMQQCGQYVLDKLAPVLTVALVTSTAVAPLAPAAGVPGADRSASADETADLPFGLASDVKERPPLTRRDAESRASSAADVETAEGAPPADASPTPAPSATPAPAPTDGEQSDDGDGQLSGGTEGSSAPAEGGSSSSPRGPFAPAVGFDWGRPIPALQPSEHTASVSCEAGTIDQWLKTAVDDDDTQVRYSALLQFHAQGGPRRGEVTLEFTVWKGESEISYNGQGTLTQWSQEGDLLDVAYSGDYASPDPRASQMDLPQNGTFLATLTLDCAAHSVVDESVTFRR